MTVEKKRLTLDLDESGAVRRLKAVAALKGRREYATILPDWPSNGSWRMTRPV